MNAEHGEELPMGLGMALAQNESAMVRFAGLPEAMKQTVVAGARQVRSKEEMREYVEKIGRSE